MGAAPSGYVKTIAGSGKHIDPLTRKDGSFNADGEAGAAVFFQPSGIAYDAHRGRLLVADKGSHRVRAVDLSSHAVSTFAGSGHSGSAHDGGGAGAASATALTSAEFASPLGVCVNPVDQSILVTDQHRLRRIDPKTGTVTVVAGSAHGGHKDGDDGAHASFYEPWGVVCAAKTNRAYVCDTRNHRIRCVDLKTGAVTTVCGNGHERNADGRDPLQDVSLFAPRFCAFDPSTPKPESVLYITCADALRRWDLVSGEVTTVPANVDIPDVGVEALNPYGIAATPSGVLIVGCRKSEALYAVDPRAKPNTTELLVAAGKGCISADGMSDEKVQFADASGLWVDVAHACVYVCGDRRVRRVALKEEWCAGGKDKSCTRVCG